MVSKRMAEPFGRAGGHCNGRVPGGVEIREFRASYGSRREGRWRRIAAATVNVHEAETHLSRLLAHGEAEEEIVIARNGKPAARLVACKPRGKRRPGALKGKIEIDDGFFDPLPEEELAAREGR